MEGFCAVPADFVAPRDFLPFGDELPMVEVVTRLLKLLHKQKNWAKLALADLTAQMEPQMYLIERSGGYHDCGESIIKGLSALATARYLDITLERPEKNSMASPQIFLTVQPTFLELLTRRHLETAAA